MVLKKKIAISNFTNPSDYIWLWLHEMNHSRNWSEGNLFSFTFCDSANFPITARIHVFDESHRPFISFYLTILQKNQVSFFDIQPFGNFLQVYRVTIHSCLQRCQKVFLLLLLPGGGGHNTSWLCCNWGVWRGMESSIHQHVPIILSYAPPKRKA